MEVERIRERLKNISTTHICDAYPNVRLMDCSLKAVNTQKMIGIAFTVSSEGDLMPVMKGLKEAGKDSVLVISSSSNLAIAGEIFASEAKRKKLAGIIIDGFCRDIDDVRKTGIPYYTKGVTPKAGTKEKIGNIQTPTQVCGIMIHPGDIVFGDSNGVVVLNEKEYETTISIAEKIKLAEEKVLEKINKGISLLECINFDEHYKNICENKKSSLKWTV